MTRRGRGLAAVVLFAGGLICLGVDAIGPSQQVGAATGQTTEPEVTTPRTTAPATTAPETTTPEGPTPVTAAPETVIDGSGSIIQSTDHAETDADVFDQVGGDLGGEPAVFQHYGRVLALSADGNRVAIGSNGRVEVLDWNGTTWVRAGSDFEGQAEHERLGNTVAMSADGNRLAMSAFGQNDLPDGNVGPAGRVRVFDWDGSAWTQRGEDLVGATSGDEFGSALSMSADGTRLAVGAWGEWVGPAQIQDGRVRFFNWDGSAWNQTGEVAASRAEEVLGRVAVLSGDGNRVAIRSGINTQSVVQVFDWNGSSWMEVGSGFVNPPGELGYGTSLALSFDGNRLTIGALEGDGRIEVFDWDGAVWVPGASIFGDANDQGFGFALASSQDGNRVAVGAPLAGLVRVFDWDGSTWRLNGHVVTKQDVSGQPGHLLALSADGRRIAIGAPTHSDVELPQTGLVRIYEIAESATTTTTVSPPKIPVGPVLPDTGTGVGGAALAAVLVLAGVALSVAARHRAF